MLFHHPTRHTSTVRGLPLRSLPMRVLSVLLVAALLVNPLAPAVLAQDGGNGDGGNGSDAGGSLFLPLVSGGARSGDGGGPLGPVQVYRTEVEVRTPAHRQTLARINPVILAEGDNWAHVLADDEQLADLARLHFNPAATNALTTLATAAAEAEAPLPPAVLALAEQIRAASILEAADLTGQAAARAALRAGMAALPAADLAAVAATAGVDTDGDGLTDDQEGFWCTSVSNQDSDGDGTKDGVEVTSLVNWMDNKLSQAPGTRKPFAGWPNQTTCLDDDYDSIPDQAEWNELGLRGDTESTDLDKFDDGEEVFGITKCPGGDNNCGYGDLPRSSDAGYVGSTMPNWVKPPGNHPLAAAFPLPAVDVVESSLQMERVTTVTTEKGTMTQTTKSYSTAKTEGTSSSIANTETWNDWQETSTTTPLLFGATLDPEFSFSAVSRRGVERLITTAKKEAVIQGVDGLINTGVDCLTSFWKSGENCGGAIQKITSRIKKDYVTTFNDVTKNPDLDLLTKGLMIASCITPISCRMAVSTVHPEDTENLLNPTEATQDTDDASEGHVFSVGSDSTLSMNRVFASAYPALHPTPTRTESSGSSRGGAVTETHTEYEEHTITNGEAFTTGEDWRTATAIDSAHAADLWFSYTVRNSGTEYARQIKHLAFNVYIGDSAFPACTYFLATGKCGVPGDSVLFENFMPNSPPVQFTSARIPLTLEQMKTIDTGGPIRIVVEDYSYGADENFYELATNGNLLVALEDGTEDDDEVIDIYSIPTWMPSDTVLDVLARYFPHETDPDGNLIAIWTPEYRTDNPGWCQAGWRPTDYPAKVLWCKHTLSTAEWWNVYTDGLGDGSEGFQDTQAVPGATALFRFNQDSDLDGFSDRSEISLGTDPTDPTSAPRPELLGGLHNIRASNKVTSTLSLLNRGVYDAYGVEAVMVAPDDSITIDNNTVGGSGRVRALKQVIVGSRTLLQSPLPAPWLQANHAVPAAAGYFTGASDVVYTFTVTNCPAGGCQVGAGTWTLNWTGGGSSGSLNFGQGYQSPTFLPVAQGVTLALYSGSVQGGETFTVSALTPRDTFQYTINRDPFTPPLVIVSYNDPQGNHRFMLPPQSMNLSLPTDDLRTYSGQMLGGAGVEMVTSAPFALGGNSLQLLVNNPSNSILQSANLFLEFIDLTGTVVSEVPTQVTLPPGPTYTTVGFDSGNFTPPFNPDEDYIVMAFLTDYQGNILDTAGRPLSSFQADPLPAAAYDPAALTWDFGAVPQGTLAKRSLGLANTGYGALSLYLTPSPGFSLAARAEQVGGGDVSGYELLLKTADLPVGPYDETVTIKTSDTAQPTLSLHVVGNVTAPEGDSEGGIVQRSLDWPVTLESGTMGQWVDFTHELGPEPQTLHPLKVYSQDYSTLLGVGKYGTEFGQGTASYDMFGDGRDGEMPGSGNLSNNNGVGIGNVNGSAGSTSVSVIERHGVWRIQPGDVVLIHQTRGSGAGQWELNKAVDDFGASGTFTLQKPLKYNYITNGGNERAQILRVPQYTTCNVTGIVTPIDGWNGDWGGIFAVMCSGRLTVSGGINTNGWGFRGANAACGKGATGRQGEGVVGVGTQTNLPNSNGGGGGLGDSGWVGAGGGGGGHADSGAWGWNGQGHGGIGGSAAGDATLASLLFGGGGGGGGNGYYNDNSCGGSGGGGGGIIFLGVNELAVNGWISAAGAAGSMGNNGGEGAGGGAGGSIYINVRALTAPDSAIAATSGSGNPGVGPWYIFGGSGSLGRIRINHCESLSSTTNPPASTQKLTCYVAEQTESDPYNAARLNLPETFTGGRTYVVQYGRRLTFSGAGEQVIYLRIPAGLASSAAFDVLASGLPGDTALTLDIGNNNSVDWSGTVANNSTTALDELAAAFNAYWTAAGAAVSGTLDVPVKVTSSGAGQILLTNLRVANAAVRLRHVQLPVAPYTTFKLDLSVGDAGAPNVSAALDLGADGSIDWRTPSAGTGPARWETGDLSASLNAYLAGKSGLVDVPLRIYVTPGGAAILNGYTSESAAQADLHTLSAAVSAPSATAGDTVQVTASLRNNGTGDSGPVTAAFFAEAEGWGDWYLGSQFLTNLPAGQTTPVQMAWDTTGFDGQTPVKVVVNPTGVVTETNFANNTAQTTIQITPPELVTADFTAAPTSGYAPLTVQFTVTSTENVTSWLWDFGDGTTSTTKNPSHKYTAAGLFTVSLTGSGPDGSDTATKAGLISVGDKPPPPVANFSATPLAGTAPLAVTFTNLSEGVITTQRWDFGDGSITTSRRPPPHVYTAAGVYTVTLSVIGPGGNNVKRIPSLITVNSTQVCVDRPLTAGWNLLSLPVQPSSADPAVALAPLAGKLTLAFAYNGCDTADPWKRYDPAAPPAANDLTALDPTRGVWVQMNSAATARFCGSPLPAATPINLCTGWNLAGYPSTLTAPPAQALTTANGCYSLVFGYNAADAADPWKRYDPAAPAPANDLTALAPGFGYWINAAQACAWTVAGR